jgi:2-polyprenyl-3-methyl-5-hydroxy-6-metoxy-1,4-benzoquinol methylase
MAAMITATKKNPTEKILGRFGLYLTRRESLGGSKAILGSHPPYDQLNAIGTRNDYFIHKGYRHRSVPQYMDDTVYSWGWQEEVYCLAREIADKHDFKSVMDVGCGSAFKLLKYFGKDKTIGLDVAQTCSKLRNRHPDREWGVADFSAEIVPKADLVIASDVIEHLVDPDMLLRYILRVAPKHVIISTPDRNLLRHGTHNGPPHNIAHIREWNMPELHAYLSEFLEIDEHFISYAAQATQCVLARPRSACS